MSTVYLRRAVALIAVALLSTLFVPATAGATGSDSGYDHYKKSDDRTYLITIENLTEGQPFTPPVVAAHKRSTHIWERGEAASPGIQAVAENGGVPILAEEVAGNPKVGNSIVAVGAPILGGESATFEFTAPRNSRRLSIASMLICTNDGFTGVDSLKLPRRGGVPTEVYLNAYDAGTEINTEAFDDLVPPCGGLTGLHDGSLGTGASNPALAEGGVIEVHDTIQGIADLPASADWDGPVAKLTITRIDNAAVYEIKVINRSSGQPFTPPVIATHRGGFDLFETGEEASAGIQGVAENGNVPGLVAELEEESKVRTVVVGDGPVLPGDYQRIMVYTSKNARRLSFASMLICTNDGFTGLSNEKLPRVIGQQVWFGAISDDAGTELNTELFADLVPPCGPLTGVDSAGQGTGMSNPALAEDGEVHRHEFLQGNGDLLAEVHDWTDPVADILVTRVN